MSNTKETIMKNNPKVEHCLETAIVLHLMLENGYDFSTLEDFIYWLFPEDYKGRDDEEISWWANCIKDRPFYNKDDPNQKPPTVEKYKEAYKKVTHEYEVFMGSVR